MAAIVTFLSSSRTKLLGIERVPTVSLVHLDAEQRRAYVLADNKLALNAGWDHELSPASIIDSSPASQRLNTSRNFCILRS
jgi:hypothetical protein